MSPGPFHGDSGYSRGRDGEEGSANNEGTAAEDALSRDFPRGLDRPHLLGLVHQRCSVSCVNLILHRKAPPFGM